MRVIHSIVASLLSFACIHAHAAIRHFHVGAGCTYATVQAALDAERADPGSPADFIWIARNQTYVAQDIQVHDQAVFLYGGVDDCVDSSISGTTTLSGSGGAAKSVMTISGHSQVWLGGLTITQGDNDAGGVGGGINFVGTGTLKIGSSTITGNRAGYGGGINFNGTGGANDVAELWINSETLITNNTASSSGGGIRIEGNARLAILDAQVMIGFNEATGSFGGGLEVIGPARANLGSPGYRFAETVGVLYQNRAQYGGGLSINGGEGDSQQADVCLFATDPRHPVRIEANSAVHDGGGIYLKPVAGSNPGGATVRGSGYRITANSATEGSAIYAGNDVSTFGYDAAAGVNLLAGCESESPPVPGVVACVGEECNRIDGNVTQDINGQLTAGSTLLLQAGVDLSGADPVRIVGNRAAHAIRVISGYTSGLITYTSGFSLRNCLIADNVVDSDLVLVGSQSDVGLRNCTIAGNAIGAGSVALKAGGELDLLDTIFAQAPTPSLQYTGGNPDNLAIDYVLSTEVASLAQGSHVVQADPSFVNPSRGDYRLLPTSPAIDVAPPVAGDDRDLDGRLHDVDIGSVQNLDGVRDLGAFERQLRYCGAADTLFCTTFDYD